MAREFFDLLFREKSPEHWIAISGIDSRGTLRPRFFQTFDSRLFDHIDKLDNDHLAVYFGVGLLARELPYGRRGSKEDVVALPGLWLDIDIDHPSHKKKFLFKTAMAALDVIEKMKLRPSVTVHSGAGLHLYFLFEHLWLLDSPEKQELADQVSQGFQTRVLAEAKLHNAVIDMTGDISRILRVPGTTNRKPGVNLACYVLGQDPARYRPESFFQFKDDQPVRLVKPKGAKHEVAVSGNQTVLDPLNALLFQNDEEISRAFEREQTSRAMASDSEHDLSLASKLAWMQVPDERIVNALVLSRNKVDSKAMKRPDYVSRTITRAHVGVKDPEETEGRKPRDKKPQQLTEEERQDLLKELSYRFGTTIVNIIKYTGTRHSFELVTESGSFDLGTTDDVLSWRRFNTAFMQLENHTIAPMKADRWTATLNMFLQAVETRDTGSSGEDREWLKNYLMEYCRSARQYPHEASMDYPTMSAEAKVYVKDDERFIHASSFKSWMKHETRGEDKLVNYRFAARMVGLGCVPRTLSCKLGERRSSFDTWLVPRHIWDFRGGEDDEGGQEIPAASNGHSKPGGEPGKEESPSSEVPASKRPEDDPPF